MSSIFVDVIVIGAGIAGLTAARILTEAGVDVVVVDKGRSVGGRVATRRIGTGLIDHGAQFFTVTDASFFSQVDEWIKEGIVFEWTRGFNQSSLHEPENQGMSHYAVRGGMNQLAQHLAQPLTNIRVGTQIITATEDDGSWILQDTSGQIYTCKSLIMAIPAPLALDLLDAGSTRLDDDDYSALARITYSECLCGLFWVDGRVTLPDPGAVYRRNANIIWIVNNQQKGISADQTLITVQASQQYSRQMWNGPDDRLLNALKMELSVYMDSDTTIREAQLKRWRYARPLISHDEPCLYAKSSIPLIFAGDGFGEGRIEGAYLSGVVAGQRALSDFVNII
jgi:renalase